MLENCLKMCKPATVTGKKVKGGQTQMKKNCHHNNFYKAF